MPGQGGHRKGFGSRLVASGLEESARHELGLLLPPLALC